MPYKKQGFVDGNVLYANPLNKMDAQVLKNANDIGELEDLKTTMKTSVVDAINEIVNSGEASSSIEILIRATEPDKNSVLWFDTSVFSD